MLSGTGTLCIADAEIGPSDMPFLEEFLDNPIDGCDGHGYGPSLSQTPRIDANDFASALSSGPPENPG